MAEIKAARTIKSKKDTATGTQFSYCPKPENEERWSPDKCVGCEYLVEHEEGKQSYKIHCDFPTQGLLQFEPPKAVDNIVYRVEGKPNRKLDRDTIHFADSHTWLEPKLDGVRALIHCTPDGVFITSRRRNKEGEYSRMEANFPHITNDKTLQELGKVGLTLLDSEVMMPIETRTLQETMSVVGAKSDKAIARQKEKGNAVFHVFDISWLKGVDLTEDSLYDRYENLVNVAVYVNNDALQVVEHVICTTAEKRLDQAQAWVDTGLEGAIAKDPEAKYHEKRAWLKMKQRVTFEAQITGYEAGAVGGKWEHGVGALVAEATDVSTGDLFRVCTFNPGDDEVRAEWLATLTGLGRDDIIKSQYIVELEAQGWTVEKRVRHPRVVKYRPDKNDPDAIDFSKVTFVA